MKKKLYFIFLLLIYLSTCYAREEFYNGCLYTLSDEDEVTITMFFDKSAIIPISINGYPVTEIAPGAISSSKTVVLEKNHPFFYIENDILYSRKDRSLIYSFSKDSTVFIPQGIERIRRGAFSGLYLENVIIPDSVTDVDEFAFSGCFNLTELHLSQYVKHIGQCAFPRDCKVTVYRNPYYEIQNEFLIELKNNKLVCSFSKNEDVVIPDDIRIIEGFAFSHQENLKSIDIPSYVIVEPWAFSENNTLEKVIFGNAYSQIGEHAFDGCVKLKEIVLPEKLTVIENTMFNHCDSLRSIELPNILKSIEDSSFSNCGNLSEIKIPSTVKFIGDGAIPSNTRIVLDNNNNFVLRDGVLLDSELKNVIYCLNTTEKVSLPETVENINYGVFEDCKNLREIYIPSSVSIIWGSYPETTLIKCHKNSAVYEWCIKENHKFELVD